MLIYQTRLMTRDLEPADVCEYKISAPTPEEIGRALRYAKAVAKDADLMIMSTDIIEVGDD